MQSKPPQKVDIREREPTLPLEIDYDFYARYLLD